MKRNKNNWGIVDDTMIGKKFVGSYDIISFGGASIRTEYEILALTATMVKLEDLTGIHAGNINWYPREQVGIGEFLIEPNKAKV